MLYETRCLDRRHANGFVADADLDLGFSHHSAHGPQRSAAHQETLHVVEGHSLSYAIGEPCRPVLGQPELGISVRPAKALESFVVLSAAGDQGVAVIPLNSECAIP